MYLIEIEDQERESESIRHLLGNPRHREDLLGLMGLQNLSWIVMEVNNAHLVPSIIGEVDILAGPLEFRVPDDFQRALKRHQIKRPDCHPSWHGIFAGKEISEAGGILWPPTPTYVVGVEVKCAYASDRLYATKDSKSHVKGIRKQVSRLEQMGVDRVALLDVIANPPSDGVNSNAWLDAAVRAQESLEKMSDILDARLPTGSEAGHFVWSAGAVIGGDERIRGAGIINSLRPGTTNPVLAAGDAKVLGNRKVLLSRISDMLSAFPQPPFFPAVFAGCRICKSIRHFNDPECACARRSGLH